MEEMTDYTLYYQQGDGTLQEFPVSPGMKIGRDKRVALIIDDEVMSDEHVLIEIKSDGVWLTDLDSISGTVVGEGKIVPGQPVKLKIGDAFKIGDYTFTLGLPEAVTLLSQKMIADSEVFESDAASSTPKESNFEERQDESKPASKTSEWRSAFIEEGQWKIFAITFAGVVVVGLIVFLLFGRKWLEQTALIPTQPAALTSTSGVTNETSESTLESPVETATFAPGVLPTVINSVTDIIVSGPGEGNIIISPLSLSTDSINVNDLMNWQMSPDQVLDLAIQIAGENIGYVYQFVGLDIDGKIQAVELRYIKAENNAEIEGVLIPEWGDQIPVEFEWKPAVFYISNGENQEIALMTPTSYTATEANMKYSTTGLYRFGEDGEERFAILYFDATGKLEKIIGFESKTEVVGSPYEIIPQPGDTFTLYLHEFVFTEKNEGETEILGPDGNPLPLDVNSIISQLGGDALPFTYGKGDFVQYQGGTLTFDNMQINWEKDEDYVGDYVVGIAIEDLDGNFYIAYLPVSVIDTIK